MPGKKTLPPKVGPLTSSTWLSLASLSWFFQNPTNGASQPIRIHRSAHCTLTGFLPCGISVWTLTQDLHNGSTSRHHSFISNPSSCCFTNSPPFLVYLQALHNVHHPSGGLVEADRGADRRWDQSGEHLHGDRETQTDPLKNRLFVLSDEKEEVWWTTALVWALPW